MSKNTSKIDKIKLLLNKAESTTPEEAAALREAAEKMMARLGIDQAFVNANAKDSEKEKHTSAEIHLTGRYAVGTAMAVYAAIDAFGVSYAVSYKRSNADITLRIFGRESQVERMKIIGESLHLQAIAAMSEWWKANRANYSYYTENEKFRVRRQFLFSFGAGAAQRIRSEIVAAESENAGTALVLANESADAEAYARSIIGGVRKGRRLKGGDIAAQHGGRAAGRAANVGTTGVGGRNTKTLTR